MEVKNRKYLPLPLETFDLYLIDDDIKYQKEELEKFLDGIDYMNNKDFSKKVLFGQEIKSNNAIEGYLDDISLVNNIISSKDNYLNDNKRKRILNLYHGYKYILQEKNISKENLKELYSILSKDLLEKEDENQMGEYYRKNPVYIFYSDVITKEPDVGVDANILEDRMNMLLDYLNNGNNFTCATDYFIHSQIGHFYFVYLHPYYDINGRTARTTAMWYLLNNKAYPYIIFNRAIQLDKKMYYKVIRDGRQFHNVTYFLNYMLKNVQIELEKEYAIELIADNAKYELNDSDIQTLYYILSMNSLLTYYDYSAFYNRLNDKKRVTEIYKLMLESLIDKEIIIPGRKTTKGDNRLFSLNPHYIEQNEKIKNLNIERKIIK